MKKEDCAYYDNGYCRKGLPGTKCEIVGCVASMPKPIESTMIHYPSTSPIDYWYQKYLNKKVQLTWQDIKTIVNLADDLVQDDSVTETEEEYYKAILDAFNKTRK